LAGETRLLGDAIPWDDEPRLEDACTSLAADLGLRVTVLGADGRVQCDSGRAGSSSASNPDLPDVRDARATGTGTAVRPEGEGGEVSGQRRRRPARRGTGQPVWFAPPSSSARRTTP